MARIIPGTGDIVITSLYGRVTISGNDAVLERAIAPVTNKLDIVLPWSELRWDDEQQLFRHIPKNASREILCQKSERI